MQMCDMKQIEFRNVNLLMVLSINFEAVNCAKAKNHSAPGEDGKQQSLQLHPHMRTIWGLKFFVVVVANAWLSLSLFLEGLRMPP